MTLGKSWLHWPPGPHPCEVVPGRPQPCIPSSCLLRWRVLSGAPFPFSFALWPRKQGLFVVPAAAEPLCPSGVGRLSRPLPQGALGGRWGVPREGRCHCTLVWGLEALSRD